MRPRAVGCPDGRGLLFEKGASGEERVAVEVAGAEEDVVYTTRRSAVCKVSGPGEGIERRNFGMLGERGV